MDRAGQPLIVKFAQQRVRKVTTVVFLIILQRYIGGKNLSRNSQQDNRMNNIENHENTKNSFYQNINFIKHKEQ